MAAVYRAFGEPAAEPVEAAVPTGSATVLEKAAPAERIVRQVASTGGY